MRFSFYFFNEIAKGANNLRNDLTEIAYNIRANVVFKGFSFLIHMCQYRMI